jgi:hypothetical protein
MEEYRTHRRIADVRILAAMRKHTTVNLDWELAREAAEILGTSRHRQALLLRDSPPNLEPKAQDSPRP